MAELSGTYEGQPVVARLIPLRIHDVTDALGPRGDGSAIRFHQWEANLRILDVTEIKTVPYVPCSHPFVERLIGTVRRECLDQTLLWTTADLEAKLREFQHYFNGYRTHAGLGGRPPEPAFDGPTSPLNFGSYGWRKHCRGLYQTPVAA